MKIARTYPNRKQMPIMHHTIAATTLPPMRNPGSAVKAMTAKTSAITKQ